MHHIGVISDTHGLLRAEVREILKDCDIILHGGDIHREKVIEDLKGIAPVYAVRGNADKEAWAENLPEILETELFGIRIKMIHNRKELPADLGEVDLLVFGHSHKYMDKEESGIRFLNPGSCGPKRFHQPVTMAVIKVPENGTYEIKKIELPHTLTGNDIKIPENEPDMRRITEAAIKRVEKGQSVEMIAESLKISPELADRICRMYLTHPGVDIDGILNRIYGR